ncbi:ATP-binding cassette domain-containing protein [Alteromonas sp. NFXS44]|uniref:ATP-binding cassette domain-containing protein n=1 Tax=Alteromonas sp. NFXS44 TaxID=2818435 RepID=UPI0032DF9E53
MEVVVQAAWDNLQLNASIQLPATAQFIGLSGPSGAGKSTLLRCLAGLTGSAKVTGQWENSRIARVRTGLVFQDSLLFPHLSVGQNLLLAADFAKQQTYHFDEVVLGCKCNHLMTRMPDTLSGGEAQRVAIARAILNSPQILLLDEPVSALDDTLKHDVLKYLTKLARSGLKMLMVSHDLRELALYSEYMAWMEQGSIVHQGASNDVLAQLTPSMPNFEQQFSVLKGALKAHLPEQACYAIECEGHTLYARHPVVSKEQAMLTIDARDVSIDRQEANASSIVNALPCVIECVSESRGGQVMINLMCGRSRLFALISQLSQERLQFREGEAVTARFKLR